MIRSLKAIRRGRPAKAAAVRRTNVVTTLRQARLEAVRVPLTRAVLQTQVAGSAGWHRPRPRPDRGALHLRPDALQKLFTLAQAITNDYDRFAAMVRIDPSHRVGESTP